MRSLAGGIAIITAGRGELLSGMTVSSLVSLTVDPPTVLVSINSSASSWPLIEREGVVAANILTADHVALAERFSGRRGVSGPRRCNREQWTTLATGAPVLPDALAALDCEVERIVAHRSHLIVIGRVLQSRVSPDGSGLTYWNGKYAVTAVGKMSGAGSRLTARAFADFRKSRARAMTIFSERRPCDKMGALDLMPAFSLRVLAA